MSSNNYQKHKRYKQNKQNHLRVTGNFPIIGGRNKNSVAYSGFIGRKSENIRSNFEAIVNNMLQSTIFRFKILNKTELDNNFNKRPVRNYLKDLVPWDKPPDDLLTMAFCMFTKEDYESGKWSEPLTMLLLGTTSLLVKNRERSCIQIIFGFDNKNKINTLATKPTYMGQSMNYNLRLCLLVWAKMGKYDYVTTEAVNWASQRQSEKLGFEILKPYVIYPNREYENDDMKYFINILESKNPHTFKLNNLIKTDDINKGSNPFENRNVQRRQAFLMKYKMNNKTKFINDNGQEKSLKALINRHLRNGLHLSGSYGAEYNGKAVLNSTQYVNRYGYVPLRGEYAAHFTHFFDLSKDGKMNTNPFYIKYIEMLKNNNNTVSTASVNNKGKVETKKSKKNSANSANSGRSAIGVSRMEKKIKTARKKVGPYSIKK